MGRFWRGLVGGAEGRRAGAGDAHTGRIGGNEFDWHAELLGECASDVDNDTAISTARMLDHAERRGRRRYHQAFAEYLYPLIAALIFSTVASAARAASMMRASFFVSRSSAARIAEILLIGTTTAP